MYRFLTQLDALQDPEVPLRLDFKPADAVQVDFGAGPLLTDVYTGEIFKTWFFVMTLCWSRNQYAEFVRDQTVATWLSCHRRAFESFNGVPGRLNVHKSKASLLLCYVDHHDKAYDWAERRKLETHPPTGAAQLVEIRETVKEVVVPVYVRTELSQTPQTHCGTETTVRWSCR